MVGKRYCVVKAVLITWCPDGRDAVDWLIEPGCGEFSFNGCDVLFHPSGDWVSGGGLPDPIVTFMCNDFIDYWVGEGYLEEVG